MTTDWRDEHLPCGRDVGGIIDQVATGRAGGPDAHQRGCRYCRAALDEAARSWGPVHDLAAQPVQPPAGLVEAILRRVQRLAQAGWVTITRTAQGVTRASGSVVALLVEAAAEATPGVYRVGGGLGRLVDRVRGVPGAGAADGTAAMDVVETGETVVEVDVEVVAEYGEPLPEVGEAIRRNVRRALAALTGLEVADVNVAITDVRLRPRGDAG